MAFTSAYRPEEEERQVPVGALVRAFAKPIPEVRAIFEEGGPIARLKPGYQPRTGQIEFAEAVARAFRDRSIFLGQAGTGTGKSYGCLAPAILHVKPRREGDRPTVRIVYATATLNLQDQIRDQDLPFLRQALGRKHPFKFAVLKGKSNFLCLDQLRTSASWPLGMEEFQDEVEAWIGNTETGDLGELRCDLTSPALRPLREMLAVEEDDCPGAKRCPAGEDCWFYDARRRAMDADIIVTNLAVLALDLVRGGMLPPYDFLIVDEAHALEEYIRGALERTLSQGAIAKLLSRAGRIGGVRFRVGEEEPRHYTAEAAHLCKERTHDFFEAVDSFLAERGLMKSEKPSTVTLAPSQLSAPIVEAAGNLARALEGLCANLSQFIAAEPEAQDAGRAFRLAEELGRLQHDLSGLAEEAANRVLWAQVRPGNPTTLRITPVEVGAFLRSNLWESTPRRGIVLTSATLTTAPKDDPGAFDYIKRRLGLDQVHVTTGRFESPFCYKRQALYYLPDVRETPQAQKGENALTAAARYARGIAPHIQEVLLATEGFAFVLFTSYGVLRACRPLVRVPYPIRCQGDEEDALSKSGLVEWFKNTPHAILFGVSSFWEGVDVPGRQLCSVIIDKIPFPNAQDPIEAARRVRMGGAYFHLHSIPVATLKLTQGVGRLIRTVEDRGLITLLDPRFRLLSYGPKILAALPGEPVPDTPDVPDELITTLCREDLPLVRNFVDGGRQ